MSVGRAAFQILVLPFRLAGGDEADFALFRRADDGHWQGIAGGGEDDETILEAARREAFEEAGIPPGTSFYKLKMQDFVPVTCFKAADQWPRDTYLVPQYFFACDVTGVALGLSREHTQIEWMTYEEAHGALRYDSNRTGLWELSERLRSNDLRPA